MIEGATPSVSDILVWEQHSFDMLDDWFTTWVARWSPKSLRKNCNNKVTFGIGVKYSVGRFSLSHCRELFLEGCQNVSGRLMRICHSRVVTVGHAFCENQKVDLNVWTIEIVPHVRSQHLWRAHQGADDQMIQCVCLLHLWECQKNPELEFHWSNRTIPSLPRRIGYVPHGNRLQITGGRDG